MSDCCPTCGKPKDETRRCKDCGRLFTLTAGEILFFARKQMPETRRCVECRAARKTNDGAPARR